MFSVLQRNIKIDRLTLVKVELKHVKQTQIYFHAELFWTKVGFFQNHKN